MMLLAGSTLLGAVGQLFFKIGLMHAGLYLMAYIALGVIAYGVSTLIYLHVLGHTHLSWAYSFNGLSYVFAAALAVLALNESVGLARWIGVAVIAIGTAFIAVS